MMTFGEIQEIVDQISYKDWEVVAISRGDRNFLQIWFIDNGAIQKGRKWYISQRSTKSEVVQTALMAVLAAEEHEAREAFRYKGSKIFGPHYDVELLVDLARKKANLDLRNPEV